MFSSSSNLSRLRRQKFLPINLRLLLKRRRLNGRIWGVERIHRVLDISFIHFREKILDSFVVSVVMHHNKAHIGGCNKRTHEPLIKFID